MKNVWCTFAAGLRGEGEVNIGKTINCWAANSSIACSRTLFFTRNFPVLQHDSWTSSSQANARRDIVYTSQRTIRVHKTILLDIYKHCTSFPRSLLEATWKNLISTETLGWVLNTVLPRITLYPTESQAIFHFLSLRKMISSDKSLRIPGFIWLIKSAPQYFQNLLQPVNGPNFSWKTLICGQFPSEQNR